jgi:RNA polymerase sigma-70 factor, ECF subfamily
MASPTLVPGATLTLERAFTREAPALEALAQRLVWDRDEAKDLVQATLARAWEKRAQLKEPAAAPGWLRRALVNQAMGLLRRRRLWALAGRLLLLGPEVEGAPDAALERQEHLRALAAACASLSPQQAVAFSLRYLEGLSLDEVAEAMELRRGTVRVHLQRAVASLRTRGVLPPTGGAP